ncbi:MAG: substrate-binding domain-containing protein [Deltaproteobacteria bacterium]|nr:substrate-binding domain-containing protein [Deltaproteobacteria bacterium]
MRIGIAVEGCTLGLWDEVGCRAVMVQPIREKIVARAKGCGDLLGIIRRREVDVAFGWRNFDRVPDVDVEVVPLPEAVEVRRTTGIAVVAGTPRSAEARRFALWLASDEGRAIYRRWGWKEAGAAQAEVRAPLLP